MATVTIYVTGDEIGTYSSWSMSGNNNGVKVTLHDVEPLGDETDVFRLEIRQVNSNQDFFTNGQFVDVYAEPDTDPPSPPIFSYLNPQHDQFQGRASSGEHQIFTSTNVVIDINGLESGDVRYGPGLEPLRSEQLPFGAFSDTPPSFPCFAAGTLIETATGPLPVETLKAGDLVKTADHGLQPLLWVGASTVDASGDDAPIHIPAGALGNYRDLWVSPQHRLMQSSWQAEMMFGTAEHFIPACGLVGQFGITSQPRAQITYCHLLCANHEVVFAEGLATESLHLGHMTHDILGPKMMSALRAAFPNLRLDLPTARPCLKVWETRAVAQMAPLAFSRSAHVAKDHGKETNRRSPAA